MEAIKVTCDVQTRTNYKDLVPIQGKLKSLSEEGYNNLKKSILKNGIHSPCSVWQDPSDQKLKLLDGTQRFRTFGQMEREGFVVPPVPIVKIEAENIEKAKQILMTLVSQYGKIESQGLYEFALDAGFNLEQLHDFDFPNLDLGKFELEFFKDTVDINEKELDENIETEKECPSCGYKW